MTIKIQTLINQGVGEYLPYFWKKIPHFLTIYIYYSEGLGYFFIPTKISAYKHFILFFYFSHPPYLIYINMSNHALSLVLSLVRHLLFAERSVANCRCCAKKEHIYIIYISSSVPSSYLFSLLFSIYLYRLLVLLCYLYLYIPYLSVLICLLYLLSLLLLLF